MAVYRNDNLQLLADKPCTVVRPDGAIGTYDAAAYNNRTLSDHELVTSVVTSGTGRPVRVCTYNLLEQKRLCPGGYYNNPWRETECEDQAIERQASEVARMRDLCHADHCHVTCAVVLQECDLPTSELNLGCCWRSAEWSTFRSGQLVCLVQDTSTYIMPCFRPRAQVEQLTTSEGDSRVLVVYSPGYKTAFCAVHLKWMPKEDTAQLDNLTSVLGSVVDEVYATTDAQSMVLFGDFNMVSYAMPGLHLTPDAGAFFAELKRPSIACMRIHGLHDYSNVHNEPVNGIDTELPTTSDYIVDIQFAPRVPQIETGEV
jgi:hypothetical protein